jgi:acyl carrier protein
MDVALRAKMVAFIKTELARGHAGVDVERDSLIDSGIIDSVGIMKLVDFLAKELKVQISDDDLVPDNFENVEAIVRLVDLKSGR